MKTIALALIAIALAAVFGTAQLLQIGAYGDGTADADTNSTHVSPTITGDVAIDIQNTAVTMDNDAASIHKDLVAELDAHVDGSVSRMSNAHVLQGFGWATQGDTGMFIRVILAERVFVDNGEHDFVRGQGMLYLDTRAYALTHNSDEQPLNQYSVWSDGVWVGTLDIDDIERHGSLVVFDAVLRLENEGSYELEFAAQEAWIREATVDATVDTNLDARLSERAQSRGWDRLRAIFSGNADSNN